MGRARLSLDSGVALILHVMTVLLDLEQPYDSLVFTFFLLISRDRDGGG